MKLWVCFGEDYSGEIVNQLMNDKNLKLIQRDCEYFFCLDDYVVCVEFKHGVAMCENGVESLFYCLNDEYDEEEFYMFRDDFRFMDWFYDELFYENFENWLSKVRILVDENKKYLH